MVASYSQRRVFTGTSGYSFADWVGAFYPPGTQSREMFGYYAQHFPAVELNFTYYRIPNAATLQRMAQASPEGFQFWVKANQETTHKHNRKIAGEFIENLQPLADRGKLAGVLLQFPQSFHRVASNRVYLAQAVEDLGNAPWGRCPLAVEFRHRSWEDPATLNGLREREVTLVVPDVPDIRDLFHCPPTATTPTGYLRLHSRNAGNWYAGEAQRYDYSYSEDQLRHIVQEWSAPDLQISRLFTFFNNCHGGQAARNAEAFQAIVNQIA